MEVESPLHQSFGELLRTYRKRQRLTQKHLAQRLQTHANTISSWELGSYLPQTRGLVLELARHLELTDQETRLLLEASLTALASYWHLPFPRNPFFTGREDILTLLHQHLSHPQASCALHGLGGMGKSQIAVEYAYRHAQEYTALFWIGAETPESIASSFVSIATVLGLPERQAADHRHLTSAVHRWLSMHRQWLLIWDNVEDLDLLSAALPSTRQGAMLFTTRRQTLGTLARGIELQPMKEEEGTLFLLRRARLLDPGAAEEHLQQLVQRTPLEYAAARELVTAMDGLPLALDQVGAYVQETPCSLAEYRQLYHSRQAELLNRRGEMVLDHPASVVTTWSLSFEKVEQANAAAVSLLRLAAFLHPEAIPEELFREGSPLLGEQPEAGAPDPFSWHEAIRAASAYSLLKRNSEEQTFSLHRLVQAVLRERMSEQEREVWQQRAIHRLNRFFPEVTAGTRRQCERLLPHVLTCAASLPAQTRGRDLAEVLRKVADFLGEQDQNALTPSVARAPLATSHDSPAQVIEVSMRPVSSSMPAPLPGGTWSPAQIWDAGSSQHGYPGGMPATAPISPRSRAYFPLAKDMPVRKRIMWMAGYLLFSLVWWVPGFEGLFAEAMRDMKDMSMSPLVVIYLLLLFLFLAPTSVLLAGTIFGGKRGALVTSLYIGAIAAFTPFFLGKTPDTISSGVTVFLEIFFCWTWPLASLAIGLFYQRHSSRSFRVTYSLTVIGISIMVLGGALLFFLASMFISDMSPTDIVTADLLILLSLTIGLCLLALPITIIVVMIQHGIERARISLAS